MKVGGWRIRLVVASAAWAYLLSSPPGFVGPVKAAEPSPPTSASAPLASAALPWYGYADAGALAPAVVPTAYYGGCLHRGRAEQTNPQFPLNDRDATLQIPTEPRAATPPRDEGPGYGATTDQEPESPSPTARDFGDLSRMAGGGGGERSALPTLQGDTTWAGQFAFPAVGSTDGGQVMPLGTPVVHPTIPGADLYVMGGIYPDAATGQLTAATVFVLSSPLLGYDMINWAENGSILPQDRVFYDYRHFDAVGSLDIIGSNWYPIHGGTEWVFVNWVPTYSRTLSVDRHMIGFERTLGKNSSFEFRLPFHSQIVPDGSMAPDGAGNFAVSGDALQIGNVGLSWKTFLLNRPKVKVTGGLGLQLPTSVDTSFEFKAYYQDSGVTKARINAYVEQNNETVWLAPFLGLVYAPSERYFAQMLMQLDIPLNESSAEVVFQNEQVTGGIPVTTSITQDVHLNYNPLLRINPQFGYVLWDHPDAMVNRVTGLMEVNVNSMLGNGPLEHVVNLGPSLAFDVGHTEISVGSLVPVTGDHAYDWELAARVNHFF
jgi:hypothetical protein